MTDFSVSFDGEPLELLDEADESRPEGYAVGLLSDYFGEGLISALVSVTLTALIIFFLTINKRIISCDYDTLTQDGENRYAMWSAFANFLDNFTSLDKRLFPDVKEWRRYLVYTEALGRSKKVSRELKDKYPDTYNSLFYDDYWFYDNILDIVESLQSTSYNISDSSYDGGDGGSFSLSDGGGDSGSSGGDFD